MLRRSSLSSDAADSRSRRTKVFVLSALLGALLFILIYGPYVLDPFYDDWIFMSWERDIVQHYVGFCLYRSSPWQFPIGLVTTASYPHDMSVVYTDAIPLLAFLGKLMDPVLPTVFQYLGIYGMISMALTGGMGGLIVYEHTGNRVAAVVSSAFYSLSWTLLYRMFYHTSLTSHWLILLAFYIWIRKDLRDGMKKAIPLYICFSAAAMLIHPYIWAMCAGITAMSLIEELVEKKDIKKFFACGTAYCFTGALSLYVFGALTSVKGASLGAGSYEANLNAFFNSMDLGLVPGLPVALLQYEGFGYLGAGILLLILVSVILAAVQRSRPGLTLRRRMYIITALCFLAFCIIPEISWCKTVLLDLDLGKLFGTIVGIFRSNGRFIWPVGYMLMTAVIVFICRHVKGRALLPVLAVCLAIQVADMMPFLMEKHDVFARSDYEFTGILDDLQPVNDVIDRYDHIVLDIKDGEIDQDISYYAYRNGLTTNDFYYARPIENQVQNTLEALRNDMANGKYDDTLLYVLGKDTKPKYKDFDLHFYEIKGRYLASHVPIEGLTETE